VISKKHSIQAADLTIELSLLGQFALTNDAEPVELKNKKARALLVYLAITGRAHSREHLATLLWGDRFDDQARSSLRQALFALRQAIGSDVIEGDDRLELCKNVLTVQSLEFKAEAPYPGTLLPNFQTGEDGFDNWLRDARVRTEDMAVEIYRQGAERVTNQHDHLQALELARRVLDLRPLDETAVRLAMRALAALGQRSDALKHYSEFAKRLSSELTAEPDPETVELSEDIRHAQLTPSTRSADHLGDFVGKILIGPFEDLGGGDLANFLAHELPNSLIEHALKGMFPEIAPLQMPIGDHSTADLLAAAKVANGVFMTTGSTRQIGDQVRVSLQFLSVEDGKVLFSQNEVGAADDAFSFLDGIGEVFQSAVHESWMRAVPNTVDYLARLEAQKNSESHFVATLHDYFASVFYKDNSLAGFEAMDQAADLAVSLFPKHPFCLQFKGWAVYSRWDMSDGSQRRTRYEEANEYFGRALAIDPNHQQARLGRFSVSYWLGDFATTDAIYESSGESFRTWPVLRAIYANSWIFRDQIDRALADYAPVLLHEAGAKVLLNRHAMIGLAHFCRKEYDEALKSANASLEIGTDYWVSHIVRIAALQRLGRSDLTPAAITDYAKVYANPNVVELNWLPFVNQAVKSDLLTALEAAGLPEA
jgi:DNA-binding SARP family transcriptional activator